LAVPSSVVVLVRNERKGRDECPVRITDINDVPKAVGLAVHNIQGKKVLILEGTVVV